jgi:hypothetical protein
MQHPDEGTIHTWLDGELAAEDAATLDAHVVDCPQCAAAVAEARGLIAGSSRIVSSLDSVPGGVIPTVRPTHRAWYATTQFRAAAALLLVAGTSLVVIKKSAQPGDKVMLVAAPRAMATDAISPQPAAATVRKAAPASKPALASGNAPTSSNAAVAATAAPLEKGRSEVAPLGRTAAIALAGARDMALKSAAPRPVMQDSSAAGAVAAEGVPAENTLKLIRTDSNSMHGMKQRVFEMANGVQLIMTESDQLVSSSSVAQSTSAKALTMPQKEVVRTAPTLSAAPARGQVKFSDHRTITWVDAVTGCSYSLTGPLPPDQLEKLKTLVVKLSQ